MTEEFIEYRVRPVIRYAVTRFESKTDSVGSAGKGEFDNHGTAYAVAYALAKEEHGRLGYPPADMRIRYPEQRQDARLCLSVGEEFVAAFMCDPRPDAETIVARCAAHIA